MPVEKIQNMGMGRQRKVAEIVEDGLRRRLSAIQVASRLKRLANTPAGRDKRDWERVARTEMTDTKSREALDSLRSRHGDEALVYRLIGDACQRCKAAFGPRHAPRKYRASKIPDELVGAVHPNCKCGPWQVAEVRKARFFVARTFRA